MSTHFDHKGKIFTDVISKQQVAVIVQTTKQRIAGILHMQPDRRLKDELNARQGFLALTDVRVLNQEGAHEFESEFLAVNREHILWVIPENKLINEMGD